MSVSKSLIATPSGSGAYAAAAAAAEEEEEEDCIEICWCVDKKFCRSHPLIQISR